MDPADSNIRDLLIVDDDSSQIRLFKLIMHDLGVRHRIHAVSNGPDALSFLRRLGPFSEAPRPELILLDINMPGMDGCTLLREIKSDPQFRCIPVIMLTLSELAEDFSRCYDESANACIRKGIDYDSSLSVIRGIETFWLQVAQLPE